MIRVVGGVARALGYTNATTDGGSACMCSIASAFNPRWSLNVGLRYDDYSTKREGPDGDSLDHRAVLHAGNSNAAGAPGTISATTSSASSPSRCKRAHYYISTGTSTNPSAKARVKAAHCLRRFDPSAGRDRHTTKPA